MMAGDQVSGDAQVPSVLADRTPLLRRLHRDGGVDDVASLFDLDGLDVEVPEDVRDELVRLLRILDDVDVFVDQALQLRDVLAFLADRLADVAFLDDEDELVAGVRRDAEGAGDVDHGTTSSRGCSGGGMGAGGVTAGFGLATAVGFGAPGGGL